MKKSVVGKEIAAVFVHYKRTSKDRDKKKNSS